MRYLPPSGTAGFARSLVNGNKRVPAPPPMMIASVRCVVPGGSAGVGMAGKGSFENDSRRERSCVVTTIITQRPPFPATFLLWKFFEGSHGAIFNLTTAVATIS